MRTPLEIQRVIIGVQIEVVENSETLHSACLRRSTCYDHDGRSPNSKALVTRTVCASPLKASTQSAPSPCADGSTSPQIGVPGVDDVDAEHLAEWVQLHVFTAILGEIVMPRSRSRDWNQNAIASGPAQ